MRTAIVLLALLAGCKDKTKAEAPKVGSASAVATPAPLRLNELRLPKLAGTPPAKSKPLDAAKAEQLAKLDVDGWTRSVRLADARGLELRYAMTTFAVTVQAANCFDCLPMELDKWSAKSGALRSLVGRPLQDHKDTTWELGMTTIGGTPYAWTHHVGYAAGPDPNGVPIAYGTAYTLYFNDGINMIRVVAEYNADAPTSRDAMVRLAPKADLEQIAKAFADQFVHAW